MKSWGRAVGLGLLVWLVPFVIAFLAFPLREPARPLFESIMAVAVTATAVVFGLAYLGRVDGGWVRQGLVVGLLWLAISVLIDAPLMLVAGPMKMSVGDYLADIGLTYLCIPAVTWGLGLARAWGGAPGAPAAG